MSHVTRTSYWRLSCCLAGIAVLALFVARAPAQDKIPVKSADDLPRHTYQIAGTATELLHSDEQCTELAKQLRADVEADLEKYQIEDVTTLKGLYGLLGGLDLLEGKYDAALKNMARVRDLEEKQAAKLMTGVMGESYIAARRAAGGDDVKFRKLFKELLLKRVRALPWDICGDDIEQRKGQAEIFSESLLMGIVKSSVDPVVAKTGGKISDDIAKSLIGMRAVIKIRLPLKAEMVAVYSAVVDEHRVQKKDIWAERTVHLTKREKLAPVVVGIWDSGVDTEIFGKQLWTNANEKPDGADNDGNGFVDDMHGIAFDLNANRVTELLHPLDGLNSGPEVIARHMKGFLDVQAAIDSEEATAVKEYLGSLKPDDVKPFIEDLSLFGNYSHGTHVAGIAADGNPFVQLLAARITFDYHMIPRCPSVEQAHKDAAAERAAVDYFKQNGVRVVNMSWGESRSSVESILEQHGVGENAEERAELSRKIFKIISDALYEAIKGAPDILFVTSAGNADNDVEFDEMIPSGYDLPNLLVVGAVDQAGDPTDFTSFGRTVGVYASGFEVDSYVPGGKRMKFSGTSMSSPNVVNLVAKMLAIDPSLTPTKVIELIKAGGDRVGSDKKLLLINPKKTIAQLRK